MLEDAIKRAQGDDLDPEKSIPILNKLSQQITNEIKAQKGESNSGTVFSYASPVPSGVQNGGHLDEAKPEFDKAWECVRQFEIFWRDHACDCKINECSGKHPRQNCKLLAMGWMYNQLKQVFE